MSLEIETRVLSTLMFSGQENSMLIQECMMELSDNLFMNEDSRHLYLKINEQYKNGKPFDIATLAPIVPTRLFDFIYKISEMWSLNIIRHDIRLLKDIKLKHDINIKLKKMVKEFDSEAIPNKACDIASDSCLEISKLGIIDDKHVFTAERNAENFMDDRIKQTPIYSSGIETLDKLLNGGFKNKSLITIAGRSGMGKTGFGVHLAHHIASHAPVNHVLFYSLEMSAGDIYEKQLSTILKKQIASVSKHDKLTAIAQANLTPFTIHTKPLASIDYIETSARITAVKSPFSVLVVDYLGIVQNKSKFESHILRQADISLRLSALAIELNCIVIALTQVNRDYSDRKDKAPITSDAADSSGSERSSSYWFGIYRPNIDDESQPENDFIVKCRKNRFGNPGWTAYFAFNEATFGEVNQYIYTTRPMCLAKGIDNFKKNKAVNEKS